MSLDFSTLKIGSIARKSTKDKEDQQVLSIPSQHEENEKMDLDSIHRNLLEVFGCRPTANVSQR